jgi:hypothetical protein
VTAQAKAITSGIPSHRHRKWPGIPAAMNTTMQQIAALSKPYRFTPFMVSA